MVTWVGLHSVNVVFPDHNHIFIEKLAALLLLSASVLCLLLTMTWFDAVFDCGNLGHNQLLLRGV